MRKSEAISDLLRPLTSRVHRLLGADAALMLRLLRVAHRVECIELSGFAEATARSIADWKRRDETSAAMSQEENEPEGYQKKELQSHTLLDFIDLLVCISPTKRSEGAAPDGVDMLFRYAINRAKTDTGFGTESVLRLA